MEKLWKIIVLTVLLQNIDVFQAFSDRNTSGQSGARLPIDGKSFKKLEKLGKLSCFFDFHEKNWKSWGNSAISRFFVEKSWKSWGKQWFGHFYVKTAVFTSFW